MVMAQPVVFKLFLVAAYTLALLIPFTSQFFLPATPIFSWLLLFYSSQFIPKSWRPHIWVSVLPTLESVLYGANISDLLTRWTNPVLDVLAWLPYGVIHFVAPFVVAACLFVFSPPGAVKFFGAAFGYMNLVGVVIQICFPCAPPCASSSLSIYSLSPAAPTDLARTTRSRRNRVRAARRPRPGDVPDARLARRPRAHRRPLWRSRLRHDVLGRAGPLRRLPEPARWVLDHGGALPQPLLPQGPAVLLGLRLPLVLEHDGAFPFLLALRLDVERARTLTHVLSLSRPQYLTHHYLIDLVAGGSLTCAFFYYYLSKMPDELRHPTTHGVPAAYRTRSASTAIPLDEESGLPKSFAHTANGNGGPSNGHTDGYGGWEEDDDLSEDDDNLRHDETRLFGSGSAGRDSFDVPLRGDMGASGGSSGAGSRRGRA